MRHWLPELLALPLLPLLLAQGRRTRRITPRLPEAAGPCSGTAPAPDGSINAPPLRLLAIGESPVAGVGVSSQEEAITAQFARALAMSLHRPVAWQALGRNGATVGTATRDLLPRLPSQEIDIALIAFGVNDSTEFRSATSYRAALQALLDGLQSSIDPKMIIIAGVPPFHVFPALPQPLRHVLGLKAQVLDRVARRLAMAAPNTLHAPAPLQMSDRALMASDGYHPSALGTALWARCLLDAMQRHPASGSVLNSSAEQ